MAWALLAATGLSAVLFRHPWLLDGVKIVGGLYLLWLGWRAASAAQRNLRSLLTFAGDTQAGVALRSGRLNAFGESQGCHWVAGGPFARPDAQLCTVHTLVDSCRLYGALGPRVRGGTRKIREEYGSGDDDLN
ncbi:LysE family transporter [Xanthomonas arboricola]|uniref:LysE family translocator n=1 Tax=Xanthomonas arboricola TaxID=56448 RepID=UPI0018AFF98E